MSVTLNTLPNDTLSKAFSYLPAEDLARMSRVNGQMNEIASDDALWRERLPGIPEGENAKNYILQNGVSAKWKLAKMFHNFVQQVPLYKKARFEVAFPYNPNSSISVDFGYVVNPDSDPDIQKKMVFLNRLPVTWDTEINTTNDFSQSRNILWRRFSSGPHFKAKLKLQNDLGLENTKLSNKMHQIVRDKVPDWQRSEEARARRIKSAAIAGAVAGGVALSAAVANKFLENN